MTKIEKLVWIVGFVSARKNGRGTDRAALEAYGDVWALQHVGEFLQDNIDSGTGKDITKDALKMWKEIMKDD
jgi:hypothetical protein